jgi:tetratricopeptide (TPR) repeat protein
MPLKRNRLSPIVLIFIAICSVSGTEIPETAFVLTRENVVDFAHPAGPWVPASVGQALLVRDRLRTGEESRATVRLTNLTVLRMDELTYIEILPPPRAGGKETLDIEQGSTYFFSREKARELRVTTPAVNGSVRGTEFVVTVAAHGKTTVTMLDGEVELSNRAGSLLVSSGEQAQIEPGQKPTKTAVIDAINIIQWCLYYPGVIDVNELAIASTSEPELASSLRAYQQGDLLGALKAYPKGRTALSNSERAYRASLLLAVGQVDKAQRILDGIPAGNPGRRTIERIVAAVKFQTYDSDTAPLTASEWLAQSYYEQSRSNLAAALEAARKAASLSPNFGYAWARIAELEFSFGRTRQALTALEAGLLLAPLNAQAHSVHGFLFSAQNDIERATLSFNKAITLDGALGNAWLGRGLCAIRQGKGDLGRSDIQTAAVLEPNRSLFRSYLGKAFSNMGNDIKARSELTRAIELDPNDPTPWLYSALQAKQEHRLNESIRDLEQSVALNNNRRVFRSQFLLDQDHAVRSTNLASIYQEDGMTDVSVREATRAVEFDYANASAHRFLADSYNALRDPRRLNLRYETPWSNELLLSNLLSPVGGGSLSAYVSEQEYSKLLEADRFGVSSTTDYYSTGELRTIDSQYGTFGNISYSIDSEYLYSRTLGRPNSQTSNFELTGRVKIQIGPDDAIYGEVGGLDLRNGDVRQLYDQTAGLRNYHFHENQEPGIALAGFHHEWNPGMHTILLAGRIAASVEITNPDNTVFLLGRDANGTLLAFGSGDLDLNYENSFEIYTGELNQIFQSTNNTLILGVRIQEGTFSAATDLREVPFLPPSIFNDPAASQSFETDFARTSAYAYDIFQPWRNLSITLGVTYDRLNFPENFRQPPLSAGETDMTKVSPKAGVTWNPFGNFIVRAAYSRALGGVTFDESILLEPTQIAGFNQVFRSIIPDSLVGAVAGPEYENYGLSLEEKFASGTYIAVQGTSLRSEVRRSKGDFEAVVIPIVPGVFQPTGLFVPNTISEELAYTEKTFVATINQLIGDEWAVGSRYQVSRAELHRVLNAVPTSINAIGDREERAVLHQLDLFAVFNHPSGIFIRGDALWYRQTNENDPQPGLPSDDFWQFNLYAGYRFHRNLAEVMLGFLNITDQNYRLNPLNLYQEIPRERTLFARVRLSF